MDSRMVLVVCGVIFLFCLVIAVRFFPESNATEVLSIDPTKGFSGAREREFMIAVASGDVDKALRKAALLPRGVNTVGSGGESALFIAAKTGDLNMTVALLAVGADPDGGFAYAPLAAAVQKDSLDVARALLQAGADPDGRIDDETALIRAAMTGRLAAVELLVTAGAGMDISNSVGVSAALFAAAADHWTVVLYLLESGADPLWTQKSGVTLAHYAYSARNFETHQDRDSYDRVKLLLLQAGLPAVPPSPSEIRRLRAAGEWPLNN